MKKFPLSMRGVCLSLALLACTCAALSGAFFFPPAAASLPAVTVAADAQAAEENADAGAYTFSRSVVTNKSLTVYYKVSGSASAGADYNALGGSAVIPAGAASVTVKITPVDDSVVEGSEAVSVTLSANRAYAVGTPASAIVNIADNDAAPTPTPTPTPTPRKKKKQKRPRPTPTPTARATVTATPTPVPTVDDHGGGDDDDSSGKGRGRDHPEDD